MDCTVMSLWGTCPCGEKSSKGLIGIGTDLNLVYFWNCNKCNRNISIKWKLEKLKILAEAVYEEPEKPKDPVGFSEEDKKLMKDMKIDFPVDDDTPIN